MIKADIYNNARSMGFRMVFWIYMIFSIAAFIICVNADVDTHYQFIRSADENFFLMGTETTFLFKVFTVLFPLTSCIIASQSLFRDIRSNRSVTQIQRCGGGEYIRAKIFSDIILTFLCTTIPLMVNLILCHLIYPSVGYDTEWGDTRYNIGACSYESSRFIDLLRMEHSTLYNIIHILLFGAFAVLISLLAVGITLYIRDRLIIGYLVPVIVFLIFAVLDALFMSFSMDRWFMYNYLLPNYDGNLLHLFVILILWILLDGLVIHYGRAFFEK